MIKYSIRSKLKRSCIMHGRKRKERNPKHLTRHSLDANRRRWTGQLKVWPSLHYTGWNRQPACLPAAGPECRSSGASAGPGDDEVIYLLCSVVLLTPHRVIDSIFVLIRMCNTIVMIFACVAGVFGSLFPNHAT